MGVDARYWGNLLLQYHINNYNNTTLYYIFLAYNYILYVSLYHVSDSPLLQYSINNYSTATLYYYSPPLSR